jgi:hypothetical protein
MNLTATTSTRASPGLSPASPWARATPLPPGGNQKGKKKIYTIHKKKKKKKKRKKNYTYTLERAKKIVFIKIKFFIRGQKKYSRTKIKNNHNS